MSFLSIKTNKQTNKKQQQKGGGGGGTPHTAMLLDTMQMKLTLNKSKREESTYVGIDYMYVPGYATGT